MYSTSKESTTPNIHYTSLSAMFNPLHSSINQKLKNHLCNQSNYNEEYG